MGGMIKIACKLPHGIVLEVGTPGKPDYQGVELTGTIKAGKSAKTFSNRKGESFGVSVVDSSLWQAWLAKNKTLRYVIDKSVFDFT
jgi:hypothetical protein